MINVSENALEHIIDLMMSEGVNPDIHFLRVGVKGGGCSGLSYVLEYVDKLHEGDNSETFDGFSVIINQKDEPYCLAYEGVETDSPPEKPKEEPKEPIKPASTIITE